jgi:DNA-binding NtrC family response regulator
MRTRPSTGPLIDPSLLALLAPISRLHATNPFDPAWTALHKAALGRDHVPGDEASCTPPGTPSPNRDLIARHLAVALVPAAQQLAAGATATPEELAIYQGAVLYSLWDIYGPLLQRLIDDDAVDVSFYDDFAARCRTYLAHPGLTAPEPPHLLALLYQARRAWYFARTKILGASPSAAASRAAIWAASMGSDIETYAASLYARMDGIPVLITGETGTGKDLAAACVGCSRYIPFDPVARRFAMKFGADYHVRNLCEVTRDLVESALFGHKKGSFTGAATDATGCFALPGKHGALFLDEAGEMPEHVQVKLLRPLQNREYLPIGETRPRPILGRLLFATNRDLDAMCDEGTFRADLHERMNGVGIHMPALRRMVAEAPGEMRSYVGAFVADKVAGAPRVETWTERVVGSIVATRFGYPWPRNLRELKNYTDRYILTDGHVPPPAVVRGAAAPRPTEGGVAPESACVPSSGVLGPRAKAGDVSLDELDRAYVTRIYMLTGENVAETSRRTGLDRRTVQRRIDRARLVRWLSGGK